MAEAPVAEVVAPVPKAPRTTIRDWSTAKVTRTLRMANMCNGVVMITIGILLLLVGMVNISFTSITVSAYVVFFGLMLACLECNMSALAPRFQRNFGFMYSFLGRSVFIVFAGTMTMALGQTGVGQTIAYIVGAFTMLNGLFNGYIICVHPAFKTGELSAMGDPYGGYTGGEAEMISYLKKNPQLANKAGSAAAQFAQQNPEVAQQAAGSWFGGGAK